MKSHITATIDSNLLVDLNWLCQQERRSRIQIIELALEAFLRKRGASDAFSFLISLRVSSP